MAVEVEVDGIAFDFPERWEVSRYDDWAFYRRQFARIVGVKAVDLLALGSDRSVWLVEVKDYRAHPRTKPSDLHEEVARKVLDTLAALLPCSLSAPDQGEKSFAQKALETSPGKQLRVALHLEQPARHSKLFPRAIDPADVQQKLRRLLKPVDPHPVVDESGDHRRVPWTTTARPVRRR